VNDLCLGLLLTVIPSIDVKARAIEMGKGGSQAQSFGGGGRNETVECRHAIVIERIQGTTESIIIELCGGNAGRNEAGGGLILERMFTPKVSPWIAGKYRYFFVFFDVWGVVSW
jgi:hypothetical protein